MSAPFPASRALHTSAALLSLALLLALPGRLSAATEGKDGMAAEPAAGAVHAHPGDDQGRAHEEQVDSQDHDHDQPAHKHEGAAEIHLSPLQRQTLDLEISALEPRVLGETLRAPGEVRLNAYATAQVTPRIEAQVIARHARLGEQVEQGQPLVTLSSVDMAEAQGDLVVAEREWQRLTKLKGQFVSESDYLEASVARQKALSRVLAYGMTQAQADALVAGLREGRRHLRAACPAGRDRGPGCVRPRRAGGAWSRSVRDHRRIGALGRGPDAAGRGRKGLGRGSRAYRLSGCLARRTRDPDPSPARRDDAHPGGAHRGARPGASTPPRRLRRRGDPRRETGHPVLAVPEAAVLRGPDGDWQVFVAEGEDTFRPVEVEALAYDRRDGRDRGAARRHPCRHPRRLLPPVGARQGRLRSAQPLRTQGCWTESSKRRSATACWCCWP